ncbi:MAG: T9SS type A sorting domain-containing protein [Bacteroidales bacterium]|nr:T9SS type A sorting domain-containing protein [Bacteroidales bacterium]
MKQLIFTLAAFVFSTTVFSQNLYVDSASTCTLACNGNTWNTAYVDLQDALSVALAGDTIFVAKGTYFPDEGVGYTNNNRQQYFEIPDSVVLFGGYPNGGGPRDWVQNLTILSGDINQNGYISGNASHVIFTENVSSELIVEGFTITMGYAAYGSVTFDKRGGGWHNKGSGNGNASSPQVRNCIFISNKADGGGAIYDDATSYGASSMIIENCKFIDNRADDWGGDIYFNAHHHGVSSPDVKNCSFLNSYSGGAGGSIYVGNGSYSTATPYFDSCVFESSYSYNQGGAIYFASTTGTSNPIFENCSFNYNETSLNRGGAIMLNTWMGQGRATIKNCRFTGNIASTYGGGLTINGYQGNYGADIINCVFDGNYSSYQGSAVFNSVCDVSYVNCTFTANDGDVALYANHSQLYVTNCILWDNLAGEIKMDTNSTVYISNSIILNDEYRLLWDDNLGFDGGGNRFKDPLFTNPAIGDFSLLACSPAINTGRNDSLPIGAQYDILGNPRIYNNQTVDIGAIEYLGSPSYMVIDSLEIMEYYSCLDTTATARLSLASMGGATSILWDNGETLNPAINLQNIHHKVVVSNTSGCTDSLEFSINKYFNNHIYVDSAATGDNTGCDWANAYNNLQDALYHAKATYTVHIAKGSYFPDQGFDVTSNNHLESFNIPDSVKVLGGYPSGGGVRNPDSIWTILSGEIQHDTLYSNNSYKIIVAEGVSNQTEIDGLIITGGVSNAFYNEGQGKQIESSPVIRNCTFKDNHVTSNGVLQNYANYFGKANPSIIDCKFINNTATSAGILVNTSFFYTECNPLILNCVFQGNYNSYKGGAMLNYAGSNGECKPDIINCSFINNTSGSHGGAIANDIYSTGVCSPKITNCTFFNNTSWYSNSGSIFNDESSPILNNCILWGLDSVQVLNTSSSSPTYANCIIQGSGSANWKPTYGTDGGNNIDSFPAFVDTVNFNIHLSAISPAINTGDTSGLFIPAFDLDYNHRIAAGTIDIGCYEYGSGSYATSTLGTDYQTACNSYIWIDGITYTSNNTSATYILTNSIGGDSIVTLNLTINQSTYGLDQQVACDSFVWIDGTTYYTSNNSASFTLTNADGCDSVVSLDLTINNSTYFTDVHSVCDSLVWIDGNTYYSNNNNATHTLSNAVGCDSVITLDLTINYSTYGLDQQVACDSFTWIDGIIYYASNNTASYTLSNTVGCDSVVSLNLIINHSTTGFDVHTSCDSFTWIDGITYYADNNSAIYTLTNSAGCDSVVYLDLSIDTVNSGVTQTGDTLYANTPNAIYQWLNCNSGYAIIPGESSRQFIATVNGSYAVEIKENNCTDTSACFNITGIGIETIEHKMGFRVFPNPTKGKVELFFDREIGDAEILIMNSLGQLVLQQRISSTDYISTEILGAPGVYYLRVVDVQGQSLTVKVIKQK